MKELVNLRKEKEKHYLNEAKFIIGTPPPEIDDVL